MNIKVQNDKLIAQNVRISLNRSPETHQKQQKLGFLETVSRLDAESGRISLVYDAVCTTIAHV